MLVNPSFPAKTISEFIDYAKANPDKINMASGGNGNVTHLVGEMFKMMTGINMVHLPYRGGGAALPDLLGGQVPVLFTSVASAIEYIRAGRLRALGVTSATRLEALPDVPAVGQFLPGYEADDWKGIGAPKNTPPEIIDILNEEINAALADPKFKARLIDLGGAPMSMTAARFGKFVAAETEKWGKVIRAANIKL
jgi:tripartite-type tricarboxylate transporter receptor subunit TctC